MSGLEHPGGTPARGRQRLRRGLLTAIALLYLFSVPWYRRTGAEMEITFGLPDWVAVALGCYLAAAFCNALAWLITDIPDEIPADPPDGDPCS